MKVENDPEKNQIILLPDMVVHICNPSTGETEAGRP
jgi:hypothetical protein